VRTILWLLAVLSLLLSLGSAVAQDVDTYERDTKWLPVTASMTDLINQGWRIVSFNNYETEMFEQNNASYTFILFNDETYILCFLVDPAMFNAKSKCRALN